MVSRFLRVFGAETWWMLKDFDYADYADYMRLRLPAAAGGKSKQFCSANSKREAENTCVSGMREKQSDLPCWKLTSNGEKVAYSYI